MSSSSSPRAAARTPPSENKWSSGRSAQANANNKMISAPNQLLAITLTVTCLALNCRADHYTGNNYQARDLHQLYRLYNGGAGGGDRDQILGQQAAGGGSPLAARGPGHFEFEVAPDMEPPSVRKPPYQQTALACPGADPFAGFSPRDTLCGDLNQGRVPANPLGQAVSGQAYPFELIKNKTLQFLARALPVLQLEYESIPKVARYLPANHLLNPTRLDSPVASEHMRHLNERASEAALLLADHSPGYLRAARRRRHAPAEQQPNATVVVSSAHSGKIGSLAGVGRRESGGGGFSQVVTKDGYRIAVAPANRQNQQWRPELSGANNNGTRQVAHDSRRPDAGQSIGGQRPAGDTNQSARFGAAPPTHASSPPRSAANLELHRQVDSAAISVTANAAGGAKSSTEPPQVAPTSQPPQLNQVSDSRSVSPRSSGAEPQPGDDLMASASDGATQTRERQAQSEVAHKSPQVSGAQQATSVGGGQQRRTASSACGDSGGFTAAICQATYALVEGDKAPVWVQLLKGLGGAFGAADALANTPILSMLGGAAPAESASNAKSASAASERPNSIAQLTRSNLVSLVAPFASLLSAAPSARKDSGTVRHAPEHQQAAGGKGELGASLATTVGRLALAGWASNALTSLFEYMVPAQPASRSFARRKKPYELGETFVDTPASLAAAASGAGVSPGGAAAGSKQPPTPCPSVEEYISPTFARNYQGAWKYVVQIPNEGYFTQTIQKTSCARQRCEFTDGVCHESPRWVSLLVAEIYYPHAIFGGTQAAGEQQVGAPEELGGQQLTAAPSSRHYQQLATAVQQPPPPASQQLKPAGAQDPLQMTDSLTAYNHNLNSAFISAANELGLDPSNVNHMQQLANAHNYQFLQRYGNPQSALHQTQRRPQPQQTLAAESRASPPEHPAAQQVLSAPLNQPQVSAASSLFGGYPTDYVMALAARELQQNPNMDINDLIASLRMQTAHKRRKRDLRRQQQQQVQRNVVQQRSSQDAPVDASGVLGAPQQPGAAVQSQYNNFKPSIQQISQAQSQQQPHATRPAATGESAQPAGGNQPTSSSGDPASQVECDGHDKIGCYVVRVYYDWFLVNGSCKCWKTSLPTGNSVGQGSNGNSLIRRIFTG